LPKNEDIDTFWKGKGKESGRWEKDTGDWQKKGRHASVRGKIAVREGERILRDP